MFLYLSFKKVTLFSTVLLLVSVSTSSLPRLIFWLWQRDIELVTIDLDTS